MSIVTHMPGRRARPTVQRGEGAFHIDPTSDVVSNYSSASPVKARTDSKDKEKKERKSKAADAAESIRDIKDKEERRRERLARGDFDGTLAALTGRNGYEEHDETETALHQLEQACAHSQELLLFRR